MSARLPQGAARAPVRYKAGKISNSPLKRSVFLIKWGGLYRPAKANWAKQKQTKNQKKPKAT